MIRVTVKSTGYTGNLAQLFDENHEATAEQQAVIKKVEPKIVEIAQVNQQHCIGEREQWLENVNQTHLVLASGKFVLQKYY